MKKNLKKELKQTKGITLVALVITIIVLLILAVVSLSMVFNSEGLFSRASGAAGKYNKQKARETLEIAFSDLQIEKCERGLTLDVLDTRITEEINNMGGEEIGDDKTEVIVDGYRFLVDRTIPKIVEELGAADGVVISASVRGNKGWFKAGETPNVTVTGIIKTYSGGNITTYSATKGGTAITDFEINASDGSYTISNITANTTIEIKAQDSNNEENLKTIPITIKIDGTAPTVETITAKTEGMDIKFSATGHDKNAEGKEESGIDYFNYTITSTEDTTLEGIPEKQRIGTFKQGETVTITSEKKVTYTITVKAIDYCENMSGESTKNVTIIPDIDEIKVVDKSPSYFQYPKADGTSIKCCLLKSKTETTNAEIITVEPLSVFTFGDKTASTEDWVDRKCTQQLE